MHWQAITKSKDALAVPPNLGDYDRACREFSWARARSALSGLPGGRGINIAHEAVDRHVAAGRGDKTALRFIREDGIDELTYAELERSTNRFANVLGDLGVGRADRVCTLLGRVPALYVAAFGTLKNRSTFSPLFSSLGPEPIRDRLRIGRARVLVTTTQLYNRKIAPIRASLPDLEHVLVVGASAATGTVALEDALAGVGTDYTIPPTEPTDMALLHFTSGTTGTPKGAVHVHDAVVAHHATAGFALDLHSDDVFWCTADPGWVTGTSYGVIAPLTHGLTVVADSAEFDARRWYDILASQRVTVWYTAPTALRMLMRYGTALAHEFDLSALRHIASVGEALNPEVVVWGEEAYGLPVHDNWWQTETGAIMISNYPAMEIRPGSMGRPVPGVEAGVLQRDDTGRAALHDGQVTVLGSGAVGELALRPGWPSMFRGYLDDEARYRQCFAGGWYLTGDLAKVDDDGYFWFVGRADDVIKSAGHLVGPFEVESALMEHPSVAEVGVIGKPDPVAGEIVKAFVTLHPRFEPSEELRLELLAFGRRRLGGLAPREITFDADLPHTSSGKVMRRVLRERELERSAGTAPPMGGMR
jgi:acetyl-CoA synthetase